MRSRVILNIKKRTLILVNYKCGFSALNDYLSPNWIRVHPRISPIICLLFKKWLKIVFVYRDPEDRFISFYRNWMIKRLHRDGASQNPFIKLLKENSNNSDVALYLENLESKKPDLLIDEFMKVFHTIYNLDGHTRQQVDLMRQNFVQEEEVVCVNIKDISSYFMEFFLEDIGVSNISKNTSIELTEQQKQVIKNLYVDDYKLIQDKTCCFQL